jgi:hypothetical protein
MSGLPVTPRRASAMRFSQPYLDETLGFVVRDASASVSRRFLRRFESELLLNCHRASGMPFPSERNAACRAWAWPHQHSPSPPSR